MALETISSFKKRQRTPGLEGSRLKLLKSKLELSNFFTNRDSIPTDCPLSYFRAANRSTIQETLKTNDLC
jgi:hypothetical protein